MITNKGCKRLRDLENNIDLVVGRLLSDMLNHGTIPSTNSNPNIYAIYRIKNTNSRSISQGSNSLSFNSEEINKAILYRNSNITLTDNSLVTAITQIDHDNALNDGIITRASYTVPKGHVSESLNVHAYKYSEGTINYEAYSLDAYVIIYYCGENTPNPGK